MELSKAQKMMRQAEMQIAEILNTLADETGCCVELDIESMHTIGELAPTYIADITLTL